ncbi:MAG: hypothetical protein JXA71_07860 [Chitinispirillaceae bacterium]|nr:hypothetical protein [Chitinispirillaceae bacterium]
MRSFFLSIIVAFFALMCGCYTQFAAVEQRPDTKRQVDMMPDTLQTSDNETCVWERDLMGFPYLRCYKGYYPREWYQYNFSPWWYRGDEHRYGGSRCPAYYYYDKSCGCCRYYLNNPELDHGSRGIPGNRPSTTRSAAHDTTGRVNISASTRSTVKIPLGHAGAASTPSLKYQVPIDTPATKNTAAADSAARVNGQAAVDSVKTDSVRQTGATAVEQRPSPVPQQPKPHRPSRGR